MFEAEQVHAKIAGEDLHPDDRMILFSRKDVLVSIRNETCPFPSADEVRALFPSDFRPIRIGTFDGKPCYGAELPLFPENLPDGLRKNPSRSLLLTDSPDPWNMLSRTRELVYWRRQHRFCGGCRAELTESATDLALICPACGMRYYPQIAPAVIVAVSRNHGTELLLAHNRNFEPDIYGLIAGFIESGETAEQAVAREVAEETSVRLKNIHYLSSQTWPFPNALMLAFSAEYESGEAVSDGTELTDLGWFSLRNLPKLPPSGSIARGVIDRFFRS